MLTSDASVSLEAPALHSVACYLVVLPEELLDGDCRRLELRYVVLRRQSLRQLPGYLLVTVAVHRLALACCVIVRSLTSTIESLPGLAAFPIPTLPPRHEPTSCSSWFGVW